MTAVALPQADRETHHSRRLGGEPRHMSEAFAWDERVKNWLLAILRFAVTLEQADRNTVLAIAREMDRCGSPAGSFGFFDKTSTELCNAITDNDDPQRAAILRRHFRRIDDHRLRRTFEAATGLHTL
jgi:hypothetical protein